MITSLQNKTVKDLVSLRTSKVRKEMKMFIVEGEHLVREAKNEGYLLKCFTTSENLEGELVSLDVMKKICQTNTPVSQIGVCKLLDKHTLTNKVLVLDDIQDPGNLGTLMRSAKAFSFDTIFVSNNTCDIYNDKVIRSSQGSIFKLNFIFGDKIEFLKNLSRTHKIYNTNVKVGHNVKEVSEKNKIALILGNEGNGVSKEINDLNFESLFIQMNNMESLNVGVAGSILMYELSN